MNKTCIMLITFCGFFSVSFAADAGLALEFGNLNLEQDRMALVGTDLWKAEQADLMKRIHATASNPESDDYRAAWRTARDILYEDIKTVGFAYEADKKAWNERIQHTFASDKQLYDTLTRFIVVMAHAQELYRDENYWAWLITLRISRPESPPLITQTVTELLADMKTWHAILRDRLPLYSVVV